MSEPILYHMQRRLIAGTTVYVTHETSHNLSFRISQLNSIKHRANKQVPRVKDL